MPWLIVNQTRLSALSAVPTPLLALEVHLGAMPGQPGAYDAFPSRCRVLSCISRFPIYLMPVHKSAEPLECGCLGYCWQTPIAPEARWILAGGGAERSHR